MDFLAVVLICASGVPVPDCQRDTALDVIVVGKVATPLPWLMGGMVTLARDGEVAHDHYPKFVCERRRTTG